MPTPLQILLDPVSLSVFALYGALVLWEAFAPARALPRVPGWRTRGLVAFFVYFFLSSYLPLLWADALAGHALLDLGGMGAWGAVVGVLVYEASMWVWHRALHKSDTLWRAFHQMHHSAERLDTFGAFWFSPLDMIGWTVLYAFATTWVLGLAPEAATIALFVTTFFSIFQHANVRTPAWLGYFVQRPESHSRHHERGVHARNYSDLPVFDLLLGTFENPREFAREAGFWDGASNRVGAMLSMRDVSRPHAPEGRELAPAASSTR